MNNQYRPNLKAKKAPSCPQNEKKMPLLGSKSLSAGKVTTNRRGSTRERKLALLRDVDKLKKKLRHEENIHRALERAMNRPLGALPRLPPYLPPCMLELLAEVAVLEEEVVRLEKLVVNFRQGLYQETVNISSRRNRIDSTECNNKLSRSSSRRHSRSFSYSDINLESSVALAQPSPSPSLAKCASTRKLQSSDPTGMRYCIDIPANGETVLNKCNSPPEDRSGKENLSLSNCLKVKPSLTEKGPITKVQMQRSPIKQQSTGDGADPMKWQCRIIDQAQENSPGSSDDKVGEAESEANKISEDTLKCLCSIFLRLSKLKGKTLDAESFSSLTAKEFSENNIETDFRGPYLISAVSWKGDVGPYTRLPAVGASSIDLSRKSNAFFLIRRLNILLSKLASVKLEGLTHQQKLAFWINTYNSCMMNVYLEHGIPDSPETVVSLMQKATITVGGHLLNAIAIEHFFLRLPYHLKYTVPTSAKGDEIKARSVFGLEWSEPLVTFALCCGSWSSPAVRVYTAAQVEIELEAAKREYLQAAVGISAANKLIIPKLLDWYLLDFAKDLDALVDWLCLQLPDELRNKALNCLQGRGKLPLSHVLEVMPYDFRFRYLIHR